MRSSLLLVFLLVALPAAAAIQGSSTASNCGEGGNWIDITFTTDEGVHAGRCLVGFQRHQRLAGRGRFVALCAPEQRRHLLQFLLRRAGGHGHPGLRPDGHRVRRRRLLPLHHGPGSGAPPACPTAPTTMGGTVTVEFSDGTVLTGDLRHALRRHQRRHRDLRRTCAAQPGLRRHGPAGPARWCRAARTTPPWTSVPAPPS